MGEIFHHRLEPAVHRFRYPACCLGVDLEELDDLDRRLALFGHNRLRPVSIFDGDYLQGGPGDLRTKLEALLADRGAPPPRGRVLLVTTPRILGFAFNPVNFWLCLDHDGNVATLVAEVNNTFGERHAYVLPPGEEEGTPSGDARFATEKAFYVSPFNEVEGRYEFRAAPPRRELDVRIRLRREGRLVFNSRLQGRAEPLDGAHLARRLPALALSNLMTLPRIHLQAARLFFHRKLPITVKPPPRHPDTLKAEPPTLVHRAALNLASALLRPLSRGRLTVELPDGTRREFGGTEAGEEAALRVNNYDFFLRLLVQGDVALGEGYRAREVDCPDVAALVRLLIDNREALQDRRLPTTWPFRLAAWVGHLARANTRKSSRRNIRDHYDQGNDLFAAFLDPSMTYSCAFWRDPAESLEQAQRNKYDRLIEKARLEPGHHVLEIGCGWGGFALRAAREVGCRVTGVTLSEQQLEWARRRVREEGLQDRVRLELRDYRDLEGRFDRIVSIEMLEAVGHENLGRFFRTCDRLLAPEGLMAVQVITVPDPEYDTYRRHADWVQRRIFPGGHLPCLAALTAAAARHSRFVALHVEDLALHYARTLQEWRLRFAASRERLEEMGLSEEVLRTWAFYFGYCEAGFACRTLGNLQILWSRPGNPTLRRGILPA